MATRVAINGLGRIGRATLKIIHETPELELLAVNDVAPQDDLAYLVRYDSVYGRSAEEVGTDSDALAVGGARYRVLSDKDPAKLPWGEMDADIVFECTGVFTRREDLQQHLDAVAKVVILSAAAKGDGVPFVVHGVSRAAEASDVLRDPRGSLVDLTMTTVVDGDLVKVMSWYDNEWGYAAQMVREGIRIAAT